VAACGHAGDDDPVVSQAAGERAGASEKRIRIGGLIFRLSFAYARGVAPILSDKQAAEIERQRTEGVVGGPLVLSWVDRLLADRKARVKQLQYLQKRLRQAFRYLDGLITHGEIRPPYSGPAADHDQRGEPPVLCPICRKPHLRASGIAYQHDNGRQCRAG
jgi:hypothetical protein